jgi:hypothetical protein
VQLVYSGDTTPIRSGARIRGSRKLLHAVTGHHHPKVLMRVGKLVVR